MHVNPGKRFLWWPSAVSWLLLSLLIVLSYPAVAQQGSVQSELSTSTITLDESVTLSVIAIGVDGELDTSALSEKFDVVGRASSRQVSSVIGSNNQPTRTSVITWTLELMPREAGIFTVPAVKVDGVSSQLLTLTVNEVPAGARRDVFVEATLDTRTPWVQSQVLMTIRVFQGIEIVDGGLSDPVGKDIQVQRIDKDVYSNEVRDGRQYSVTERRFALFPQKSGSLVVDPVILSISVPADHTQPRGLFSATRKITRRTDSLMLDVQARPPSGNAWWLPASGVTLESSWAADGSADARVDQPLTRTITMRGRGVLDSQLPEISIPAIDGVSLYAEEPVRTMSFDERGLVAEQSSKWALIPQREGELLLPAVSVEWFNTVSGQMETALLAEETIRVGPSINVAGGPAQAADGLVAGSSLTGTGSSGKESSSLPPVDATAVVPGSTGTALMPDNAISNQIPSGTPEEVEAQETPFADGLDALTGRIAILQSSINTWRVIALMLLALWLFSVVLYWWKRRQIVAQGDAAKAGVLRAGQHGIEVVRNRASAAYQTLAPLAPVESACLGTDPAAVSDALLGWAARQWPQQPPLTLIALASMFDEGVARQLIQALDASLYSRAQGDKASIELMTRLRALPAAIAESSASGVPSKPVVGSSNLASSSRKRGRGLPDL